jgi:hypothetical protein
MRYLMFVLVACSSPQTGTPGNATPQHGAEETVPTTARLLGECDDAKLVTLEAIVRGEGVGERIAIDAVPRADIACTTLACDNACCNKCGGVYSASLGDELRITFNGLPGTCGGMDCSLHCEPFGIKPRTQYRFVGTGKRTPRGPNTAIWDHVDFTVEKYCRSSLQ